MAVKCLLHGERMYCLGEVKIAPYGDVGRVLGLCEYISIGNSNCAFNCLHLPRSFASSYLSRGSWFHPLVAYESCAALMMVRIWEPPESESKNQRAACKNPASRRYRPSKDSTFSHRDEPPRKRRYFARFEPLNFSASKVRNGSACKSPHHFKHNLED